MPQRLLTSALVVLFLLVSAHPPVLARSTTASNPPQRHTVSVDDGHPLTLWSRQAGVPKGVVVFVHGRTWSGLPNFDLQLSDAPRSVLAAFADAGYAAYALDQRGYGATARDASGWLTPERATRDLQQVAAWVRRQHPELPAPTVVGYSQGALVGLLTEQHFPGTFAALVLFGFPGDLDVPRPPDPGASEPSRTRTTAEGAASDFVAAGGASPAVIQAYVEQALASDPVRVDWRLTEQFSYELESIATPTLLLQGIADNYTSVELQAKLFTRLGTTDKQWVVLPHADHAAHVSNAHDAWVQAILHFIERPPVPLEQRE